MVNWINFQHIQRFLFAIALVVGLSACGADEEQTIDDAVDVAQSYLTTGDCQRAIDTLEDIGRHPEHYRYVKTLATGYACRAGYSTPNLYGNDLTKIGTPSLLGGMGVFTTSDLMESPDDPNFEDLQTAMNVLLYSGEITETQNPTSERRSRYFSSSEVANMDTLLLYLTMVQIGMFVNYYGDIDNSLTSSDGDYGLKGAASNGTADYCLFDYDGTISLTPDGTVVGAGDTTLDDYLVSLAGTSNACDGSNGAADGYNPYLGTNSNMHLERMCQGVVLLNTFFNALDNVVAQLAGDSFSSLGDSFDAIDVVNGAIAGIYPDAVNLIGLMNQENCEDLFADNSNDSTKPMQVFYALYYEALFQ